MKTWNLPETWDKEEIQKESLYHLANIIREKINEETAKPKDERFMLSGLREALRVIYKQAGLFVPEQPVDHWTYLQRFDN